MPSFNGSIAYAQYEKGTTKGQSVAGEVVNDPWKLGNVDSTYTSQAVVETMTEVGGGSGVEFMFQPVDITKDADGKHVNIIVRDTAGNLLVEGVNYSIDDSDKEHVKLTNGGVAYIYRVGYKYDNVRIPQEKLPTLKMSIQSIALEAKARRIAIRYSQMAAFQAKQDYGIDMAGELAKQAVAELNYEIDTDICQMLMDAGKANATDPKIKMFIPTWSRTLPIGVNKKDHYAGFAEVLERGKVLLYDATKKHMPNVMLASSALLPVLGLIDGWQAAPLNDVSGPFYAGSLNGLKVYISPMMESGEYALIVNKGAMEASAGVFAPYMAVVPTMTLQGPDGATATGWSTLYDAKILNQSLVIVGKVTD